MRIFKRKRAGSNYPQQDKSSNYTHKKIHKTKTQGVRDRIGDFLEGVADAINELWIK